MAVTSSIPIEQTQHRWLLLVQYGESVDVADWFSGFCAVHDSSDGMPKEEQQADAAPKPKKRRGRPSKKVLQRVCSTALSPKFAVLSCLDMRQSLEFSEKLKPSCMALRQAVISTVSNSLLHRPSYMWDADPEFKQKHLMISKDPCMEHDRQEGTLHLCLGCHDRAWYG